MKRKRHVEHVNPLSLARRLPAFLALPGNAGHEGKVEPRHGPGRRQDHGLRHRSRNGQHQFSRPPFCGRSTVPSGIWNGADSAPPSIQT